MRAARAAGIDAGHRRCAASGRRTSSAPTSAFLAQVRPYYARARDGRRPARRSTTRSSRSPCTTSRPAARAARGARRRSTRPTASLVSGPALGRRDEPRPPTRAPRSRRCRRALGITREQTMAFGDYFNDVGMLEAAHWSFAMDNAHPDVRARSRGSSPRRTRATAWSARSRRRSRSTCSRSGQGPRSGRYRGPREHRRRRTAAEPRRVRRAATTARSSRSSARSLRCPCAASTSPTGSPARALPTVHGSAIAHLRAAGRRRSRPSLGVDAGPDRAGRSVVRRADELDGGRRRGNPPPRSSCSRTRCTRPGGPTGCASSTFPTSTSPSSPSPAGGTRSGLPTS